jgi:hypothetical protein
MVSCEKGATGVLPIQSQALTGFENRVNDKLNRVSSRCYLGAVRSS